MAVAQTTLSAIWALPFGRAYHFYRGSKEVHLLDNSADSAADFEFSLQILFCYGVSFVIANILVCLWWKRRSPTVWWCSLLAFLFALWLAGMKPESVIVMLPNFAPYLVFIGHCALGLVGVLATTFNFVRSKKELLGTRSDQST
ncbi:hypothetical protein EON80_01025 [bacterium]|nr:MAG: hypothetical protein EON80_01025 [bacterium]